MQSKSRIRVNRNGDYPAEFGWPFTASLEQWDEDDGWVFVGAEDGDTEAEAVVMLRTEYASARKAALV